METLNYTPGEPEYEIKPCPFCGDEEPRLWEVANVHWIQCRNCNATTSFEHNSEEALVKWNARIKEHK